MQVRVDLILASLLLVGLILKLGAFMCFCICSFKLLCRFSLALTDVHVDTSTKLDRRGRINRVYPQTCQTVWAIT